MAAKKKKQRPDHPASDGPAIGGPGGGGEGDEGALAFEDAIEEVEAIVREMENDRIPLESLLRQYERGTQLIQVCQRRIDEAQARIEMIAAGDAGKPELFPFEESGGEKKNEEEEGKKTRTKRDARTAAAASGAPPVEEGHDDDVRLL